MIFIILAFIFSIGKASKIEISQKFLDYGNVQEIILQNHRDEFNLLWEKRYQYNDGKVSWRHSFQHVSGELGLGYKAIYQPAWYLGVDYTLNQIAPWVITPSIRFYRYENLFKYGFKVLTEYYGDFYRFAVTLVTVNPDYGLNILYDFYLRDYFNEKSDQDDFKLTDHIQRLTLGIAFGEEDSIMFQQWTLGIQMNFNETWGMFLNISRLFKVRTNQFIQTFKDYKSNFMSEISLWQESEFVIGINCDF
jgi:hypothetical protein